MSVNKCSLLNIGHVPFDVTYHINGSSLSYQSHCQDLGVIITHDLSPSTQISEIVAKAHQRANIIHLCHLPGRPPVHQTTYDDNRRPVG